MCLTFCHLSIVDYESRAGNRVLVRGLTWEVEVRPLPPGGEHDVRGCHRTVWAACTSTELVRFCLIVFLTEGEREAGVQLTFGLHQ